jgi:H+-transporting ATPase
MTNSGGDSVMTVEGAKKAMVSELFRKLSSSEGGLSVAEAKKRIQENGYNEIPEKKTNPFLKFLKYFWGPIPWMIEAAVILSAYIRHWEDVGVITALLLLNAVVGFWQEKKADNAIELLKQKLAQKARVVRDGNWQEVR